LEKDGIGKMILVLKSSQIISNKVIGDAGLFYLNDASMIQLETNDIQFNGNMTLATFKATSTLNLQSHDLVLRQELGVFVV
jgi:hypothetical protein